MNVVDEFHEQISKFRRYSNSPLISPKSKASSTSALPVLFLELRRSSWEISQNRTALNKHSEQLELFARLITSSRAKPIQITSYS